MPSSMIHFYVVHEYKPDAPGEFFAGNIAPDTVNEWELKDRIHLRRIPDRLAALGELAARTDPEDQFSEGWLLHLYTDLRWDEGPVARHHEANPGDGWFTMYRSQIAMATYHLYHTESWAREVAALAAGVDITGVPLPEGISCEDVKAYTHRVRDKHVNGNPAPSPDFPPDMVAEFARETARMYAKWRQEHAFAPKL